MTDTLLQAAKFAEQARPVEEPGRILVVDDDQGIRSLVKTVLDELGYNSVCCKNGQEAFDWLNSNKVELMLLDYTLPDMNGAELLESLREANLAVPFIAVTGRGDENVAVKMMKSGARDYVVKNNTLIELLPSIVNQAMEQLGNEKRLAAAEKSADQSLLQYEKIFNAASDGFLVLDLQGRIVDANQQAAKVFCCPVNQLKGSTIEDLLDEEDKHVGRQFIEEVLETGSFRAEGHAHSKDEQSIYIEIKGTAFEFHGRQHLLAILRDITEQKSTELKLRQDALYDKLTALPNRALLVDRLSHVIEHKKRNSDYKFAVLFLDLDGFKLVNDSLGHLTGDHLIRSVASRLKNCARQNDTVARVGGDEFVILQEDIRDLQDCTTLAKRIKQQLSVPYELDGHEVMTSASIGIVIPKSSEVTSESLLRDADIAMYRAKGNGKSRYEIFDHQMHKQVAKRLRLETDLRMAVRRNEFELFYQPLISLRTGRIVAFEALLRWNHPIRKLLSPGEFIHVAEETGLIVPIGEWVLNTAARQLAKWQRDFIRIPSLAVSVNVSAKQFFQGTLVNDVARVIKENNLKKHMLMLEMTESTIMEDMSSATDELCELKDLGVRLLLDDFGTGYSSLSLLQHLPLDSLKISRTFISRMTMVRESEELVRTIVNLARNLDLTVVAEGEETFEQMQAIKRLKCEFAQGYYFSPPVNATAATTMLADNPRW